MKYKRGLKLLLLIAVVVMAMLSLPQTWLLAGLTAHDTLTRSDVIVLLAGDYKERAPAAAMLYRDGYAPMVMLTNDGMFSSWSTKYNRNLFQIEWAAEELVRLGVPRARIVTLPFYGNSTMFDALAVKRHLLKSGLKKIILVTSDYHTRRALWTFTHAFKNYPMQIAVYPALSGRVSGRYLIAEYVKFGGYLLKYGVLGLVPETNEIRPEKK